MKIFSSKSLLSRLNKTFDVLKGGGQFPARHQTMRNTIAWSYDLLETEEEKLLCQVSVFVGGFTMEAIEIICEGIEGFNLARFYHYTPNAPKAIPIFEECLAYWRKKGDQNNIGLVLNDFGFHIMRDGFYEESNIYSLEAKSIFEKLSHKERLVTSINNIGMSNMWRGRPLEAIPYFRKTRN